MGSADWMPRNLDKRVEILFPLDNDEIKEEAFHILKIQLADNVKAHILQPDGTYEKIDRPRALSVFHELSVPKGVAAGVPERLLSDGRGF